MCIRDSRKAIEADTYNYYDYDTYMSLSDYNALRKMLGYEPVSYTHLRRLTMQPLTLMLRPTATEF